MLDSNRRSGRTIPKPAAQFMVVGSAVVIGIGLTALLLPASASAAAVGRPLFGILLVMAAITWALSVWLLAGVDLSARRSPWVPLVVVALSIVAVATLSLTAGEGLVAGRNVRALTAVMLWAAGYTTAFAAAGLAIAAMLRTKPR